MRNEGENRFIFTPPPLFVCIRREKHNKVNNLFSHIQKYHSWSTGLSLFQFFIVFLCFIYLDTTKLGRNAAASYTNSHRCMAIGRKIYVSYELIQKCFCTTTKCHDCSTAKQKKYGSHTQILYKNKKNMQKLWRTLYSKAYCLKRVCGLSETKKLSYIHTIPCLRYKYGPRNFHSASLKSLLTSSTIVLSLLREKPHYAKILRHSFFRGAPGLFILIVLFAFSLSPKPL